MAPWVIERLPQHTHYVEACAGSAAIMAIKPPVQIETVNDIYGEVVNFFRVLRHPPAADRLIDRVAFTPYSLSEFQEAGRVLERGCDDPVLRAYAFFMRMQMAVVPGKSGWSYSITGGGANKPGRWATMPELLRLTVARFERVQVTSWDIIDLVQRLDKPDVLILVDPPYLDDTRPTSTGRSSAYVHDEFDHQRFVDAMRESSHASFAVTHYPHAIYDESGLAIAGDYISHRNSPNGKGRDARVERLYLLDRSR